MKYKYTDLIVSWTY